MNLEEKPPDFKGIWSWRWSCTHIFLGRMVKECCECREITVYLSFGCCVFFFSSLAFKCAEVSFGWFFYEGIVRVEPVL